MIILPMCSLTRIFVPEYQEQLMKNPKDIFNEDVHFKFSINTSRKDFHFDSAFPKYETDSLLAAWFIGGKDGMLVQETDWTGLVAINLDSYNNGIVLGAVAGVTKIDENVQENIDRAKANAKVLSKQRVMKQIRMTNSNMLKQYQLMKEDNKNPYVPSPVEFLCAYVLAEEQKKNVEDKQELTKRFQDLMTSSFGL